MASPRRKQRLRAKTYIEDFIVIQYDKMQNRCAGYGRPKYKGMELLTREEFYNWARASGELVRLFHDWNRHGHELRYRPTVDRLDTSKGYTLGNMRWITHSENSRLGGIKESKVR